MAGAGSGGNDTESLKRLLNDTAAACQKCLSFVASQQQAAASVSSPLTSSEFGAMEQLHRRLMQLENQLAAERDRKGDELSDAQQRQIDDIIIKYKERIKSIEDEKIALEDENRHLRVTNVQHEAKNATLTQQVALLTSEVERLRSGSTANPSDDHVKFLTEQARQFRIDFESEKRDRLAAETKANELQQQLAAANAQSDLQRMQNIAQRRQASLQFYREQYDSSHAVLPSVNPSSAPRSFDRRYDGEGQDEIDAVEGYDEIDCVQKSSSAMDFSP